MLRICNEVLLPLNRKTDKCYNVFHVPSFIQVVKHVYPSFFLSLQFRLNRVFALSKICSLFCLLLLLWGWSFNFLEYCKIKLLSMLLLLFVHYKFIGCHENLKHSSSHLYLLFSPLLYLILYRRSIDLYIMQQILYCSIHSSETCTTIETLQNFKLKSWYIP